MSKQCYGITGWPLAYTLSPLMHNRAFEQLSVNASYDVYPCEDAASVFTLAAEKNLSGFNVTMPHKTAIMAYLDSVDADARTIGSVNTVRRIAAPSGWKYEGINTDFKGFLSALRYEGVGLCGAEAIILGSGGSARSIYYALAGAGVTGIIVAARRVTEAVKLHALYSGIFSKFTKTLPLDAAFFSKRTFKNCRLLVNCTPVAGIHESEPVLLSLMKKLPEDCFIFDLIYHPSETFFLFQSRRLGLKAANGLAMLVYQGIESCRYWTGIPFEAEDMIDFLRRTLCV